LLVKRKVKDFMADKDFTHFDPSGNAVMVDVSAKEPSARTAVAKGFIMMNAETFKAVQGGTAKKGDVLGVARIAGIMAAKRTAELIPLCHPLNFDTCTVDFSLDAEKSQIMAVCTVKLSGKTGAEMEALTGVSVALLTIYDMCKALDRTMVMGDIKLWEKSGGKSGHFTRDEAGGAP
jgi:cyclic pyranopterin phosphate synthase